MLTFRAAAPPTPNHPRQLTTKESRILLTMIEEVSTSILGPRAGE